MCLGMCLGMCVCVLFACGRCVKWVDKGEEGEGGLKWEGVAWRHKSEDKEWVENDTSNCHLKNNFQINL